MAVVVGVTGGVATGKSTVLKMLADLGAQTISADELARQVLAKDTPAYREVVRRFGPCVLAADGKIDRAALADVVFSDAASRRDLEAITHPRIISRMQHAIDEFRADPPETNAVLALEIPLLFERGLERMVDLVVVVAAEQDMQVRRLTRRGSAARQDVLRRMAAQLPLELKIERADYVIRNDGSIASLARLVGSLWDEIRLP